MTIDSNFQLKLSARSTLIGAFFGAAALYSAGFSFAGGRRILGLSVITLLAVALLRRAAFCLRRTRHLVSAREDATRWKAMRKFYFLDVILEWGLLAFGTSFLVMHGRFDLIPAAGGAIIGLHYFPLAIIFRASRFYWIASVLVAGSLASLLLPPGHARYLAGCCLVGLTLWIATLINLSRISPALRKPLPAPVAQTS